MLGAFIGGAVGLLLAKGISAAMFWVDHGDQRVAFLHSFILLGCSRTWDSWSAAARASGSSPPG